MRICIILDSQLFSLNDDATVVPGTLLAQLGRMAKSLANRVAALEVKGGSKTIEEQFRQEAELIDRLFAQRFEALDNRWGPRFAAMERALGVVQTDVSTLKTDVSALKSILKNDVSILQKDMAIVRDGVSILLKRLPN